MFCVKIPASFKNDILFPKRDIAISVAINKNTMRAIKNIENLESITLLYIFFKEKKK